MQIYDIAVMVGVPVAVELGAFILLALMIDRRICGQGRGGDHDAPI